MTRVLLLCHEELVPPSSIEGLTDEEISDYRAEFDVLTALRDLGYDAEVLGIPDDIEVLRQGIRDFQPHVCFNLLVEFHGVAEYDAHVTSYLELLRQPYTGCNPRGQLLARDKVLSKKLLAHAGIPSPVFQRFERKKRVALPAHLEYPLFVKSATEEASLGIGLESIVHDDEALAERCAYFFEEIGCDALVEEYIEGREFYLGVIGNKSLTTWPVWELCIDELPEGHPLIATRRVKWDVAYQKEIGIQNRRARELSPKAEREMARIAKLTYRTLGLSGYARLDLRMRPDGRIYVLEANPNPDITYGEDFAESAEDAGVEFTALVRRIVNLGRRYEAPWTLYHH
ncbi:MAG: D-alanine--D-alanine ligase [Planctomycetota bacterium]